MVRINMIPEIRKHIRLRVMLDDIRIGLFLGLLVGMAVIAYLILR